ncbi:MAG: thaumatin family protein [Gammaproteobacteria bacterium]
MNNKKAFVFICILSSLLLTNLALAQKKLKQTATFPGTRVLTFVNQCSFPVWFGFAGGSAQNRNDVNGQGKACKSNADCVAGAACNNKQCQRSTTCLSVSDCFNGSTCVATGNISQCFWVNPQPSNGNYQLAANGGTNSVTLPAYNNGVASNIVWSGAVAGRTACTSAGCETATCNDSPQGAGSCKPSRGFDQPATQAEFTFNNTLVDFYDVEVINGMNLPVAMSPTTPSPNSSNPYNCGSPGAVKPLTNTGACAWQFTPPSNDYVWVQSGGIACSSDSGCKSPAKCGLSLNPGHDQLLQKTCGTFMGFWTADQVCGYSPSYGTPFNCAAPLPTPQQNYNFSQLYACSPIGSCYQQNASTDCCGCVDWWKVGVNVPSSTQQCVSSNPTWNTAVQPGLQWIKQSCPTVYTYPYDDMSSTFTCMQQNGGTVNSANYTIIFCPGGAALSLSM